MPVGMAKMTGRPAPQQKRPRPADPVKEKGVGGVGPRSGPTEKWLEAKQQQEIFFSQLYSAKANHEILKEIQSRIHKMFNIKNCTHD